jgi:hypothetical protein
MPILLVAETEASTSLIPKPATWHKPELTASTPILTRQFLRSIFKANLLSTSCFQNYRSQVMFSPNVLWRMRSSGSIAVYFDETRRFGGIYRLQCRGKPSEKSVEAGVKVSDSPCRLLLYNVPPKRRCIQYLHGVTSQKTALFIVTAVRTSNLTTSYGEFCILGYKALLFVESQPMFRRNMSPSSSESKNKPNKKVV